MKTPIPQVLIHHVMARAYPIYKARAKASENLRRVTAATSVTTFLLASATALLLASCRSNSSQSTYDAAIQEGQTAAQELINQGVSAVAIALVDDKRIIWSQRFGLADRDTGQMPTDSTMFGVGSVSKMFATIAVMKLVDRGVVDLDTPLVTYLPAFRMASAGYEKVKREGKGPIGLKEETHNGLNAGTNLANGDAECQCDFCDSPIHSSG